MATTNERVQKAIFEQFPPKSVPITADATLEALGADSLDYVEIIMRLEEEFGIEIADDELVKDQDTVLGHSIKVSDIVALVEKKLKEKSDGEERAAT